ncbi:siderophore-interacting protein [Cesiribacter sp. SM1]|uniref:siderophore-interacting protein n=1 Tax=Cesiribacter sp. SM1 TaxID=2861196 RepID=UPI001CD7EA00|nr:siderophore-interacting protein [Cesiribacter sp. SM1]
MPRVPKWVGDTMETVLASKYIPVSVCATEYLGSALKRVTFRGDFSKADFSIGHAVAFRVNECDFRNYTPASVCEEKGLCDVIFYMHGKGPGSKFSRDLRQGDSLKMIIPRGKKLFQPSKTLHFFFGDETALGLFSRMARRIKEQHQAYTGMVELDGENLRLPPELDLSVKTIVKKEFCGNSAETIGVYLRETYPAYLEKAVFYLLGNAASIQVFRKALRLQNVSSKNIKTQAYWAEGKIGL